MQAVLSEAIQDLRRPFRLRGPTSRRAFAGLAALTGLALLILIGLGLLLTEPVVIPTVDDAGQYPFDPLRNTFMPWFEAMPPVVRILIGVALVPLLFAMVRRSTDIGIPRVLSIAGVVVLVVSTASFLFALEQRVVFPLTRGLWAIVATDAEDVSAKVAIGLVMSPFFLMTLIADLLIIMLVGLIALAASGLSALAAFVVACLPTRQDLRP